MKKDTLRGVFFIGRCIAGRCGLWAAVKGVEGEQKQPFQRLHEQIHDVRPEGCGKLSGQGIAVGVVESPGPPGGPGGAVVEELLKGVGHAQLPVHHDALAVADAPDIFRGVVEKRQDRQQPDRRGDARGVQTLQSRHPLAGGADVGFQCSAQGIVIGSQGHLHDPFALGMDGLEQVQVPQHPGGFRQQRDAEAVPLRQHQRLAGVAQRFFQRQVRVRHGTHAQHTFPALPFQGPFQQLYGIFLGRYVLKSCRNSRSGNRSRCSRGYSPDTGSCRCRRTKFP